MDTPTVPTTDNEVLMPDQLYKELDEAMATKEQQVERHQEQRSALGKAMKLDVGPPSEKVILATGSEAEARDYLGLLMDPLKYAKRDCSTCYGRGTITIVNHLTPAQAKGLIEKDRREEAFIIEREPGKFHRNLVRQCACAKRRYKKAHALFAHALVQHGLAKQTGIIIDGDGDRMDRVELL